MHFRFLLVLILILSPTVLSAANQCKQIEEQFKKERDVEENRIARERAAIADLKRPYNELKKKVDRNEITYDEYGRESRKWSLAEACIKAKVELEYYQVDDTINAKLIKSNCPKAPISKFTLDMIRSREEIQTRDCGRADPQIVADMMKRMNEIMVEKAANEEPETPAVKQADTSFKESEFCQRIRQVSSQAPTFFKSITGEKKDKDFIEEGFGLPRIRMRDLLQMDQYNTPIILALDFLSSKASCEIVIGFNSVLVQRVPPTYSCTWDYEKIARKDLEQKADRLFNAARGCYAEVSEDPQKGWRHSFIAEKSVLVEGNVYFGEGKPSHISLYVRRSTPAADLACAVYLNSKKEVDREICMQKHIR